MDNIQSFQELINYIEEHLTEEIDYNELAKILAVSEQSMQRIFVFITNMSLAEYIKKRRFSKAYEELKNTDIKIIDLAVKYQYDSENSFSRAFKSIFGITPSECRKDNTKFVQFPVYQFTKNDKPIEYSYKIEDVDEKVIYAYRTKYAKTKDDFLFRIRELYQELKDKGLFNRLLDIGMYGVTFKNNKQEEVYWVGCQEDLGEAQRITIQKGKYLVFDCGGDDQTDIAPLISNIYSQFVKSSDINVDKYYCFEYYENGNCYVYMKINN